MGAIDWKIRRYEKSDREMWNSMVDESRNGTFLFRREYMDYHSDRFVDCSWIAYKGRKPLALLPANVVTDPERGVVLQSHGGLTYGGWILPQRHLDGQDLLDIFEAAIGVWRDMGINELDYKPVPFIYSFRPSQEDEYALFRLGAVRSEANLSSAVVLDGNCFYNKLQKRHLAATKKLKLEFRELTDLEDFMQMLEQCLRDRHDTMPVHTLEEMYMLQDAFPGHISAYGIYYEGALHAGTLIYDTGNVAHAQYIATTSTGRELNLLTPLFDKLLTDDWAFCEYFDFGISNEDHGQYLNAGLLRQKYSFGATGVVYNRYRLKI